MKKILFILIGIVVILGSYLLLCVFHENSAKQSYALAKSYAGTNSFISDSSKKYVSDLDAPSCILCMDGFHKSDSVKNLVAELKNQDSISRIFALVQEKLGASPLDFADLQATKAAIDTLPLVRKGLFMFNPQFAAHYEELNSLCMVALFMENVSTYLQADEWNYHVLSGHLQLLRSLDIVKDETFLEARYRNFNDSYQKLASDRKLRGRLNKGLFWDLVDLYNEEGIQGYLSASKFSMLKEMVQDEALFKGFYNQEKDVLPTAGYSVVKSSWDAYMELHAPKTEEAEEQQPAAIAEEEAPAVEPVAVEEPKETPAEETPAVEAPKKEVTKEPAKPQTEKLATEKKTSAKQTAKAKSERQSKPTAADNRSYSEMMYGDAVEMDDSKRYSSDADIMQVITTRSALYQLNKNNIESSSLKAKVQQLKNLLDKVTESEYSHCYNASTSLQDMLDEMAKTTRNR